MSICCKSTAVRGSIGPYVSGSADQRWMALPRRSRGQTRATRGARSQRPATEGNWRVSCSCLCDETPVVAHRCFTLPRSSIMCGCINVPGKQVNAVWGRYPTACAIYVVFLTWSLLELFDKLSPAFELRNSGVSAVARSCQGCLARVPLVTTGILRLQLRLVSTYQRGHSRNRQAPMCQRHCRPSPPARPCP
jgi:hypothetical protein